MQDFSFEEEKFEDEQPMSQQENGKRKGGIFFYSFVKKYVQACTCASYFNFRCKKTCVVIAPMHLALNSSK